MTVQQTSAQEYVEKHAAAAAFVVTPLGRIVACNEAYVALLQFDSRETAESTNLGRLFPDQASKYRFMKQLFERGLANTGPIALKLTNGQTLNAIVDGQSQFDREGFLDRIHGLISLAS